MIELFLLLYIVSGILAYGMNLAQWQLRWSDYAKENYKSDVMISLFVATLSPLGFPAILMYWRPRHGLMYRNPHITRDE